jgi:hypothetical protein
MPTATFKARITAGTGDPEDINISQARSLLNVEDGANNYIHPTQTAIDTGTLSGANVISRVNVNTSGHTTIVSTRALTSSDIGAEPSFSKNTAFNKDFGTTADTVTQGNDSRLTTNLGTAVVSTNSRSITSSTGSAITVPVATTIVAGFMSHTDKSKLDDIATSANNYTHPNHTGDVTSIGDGATTIINNAVTNAKAADMAVNTIKGRITSGTGDPEDLTATQVRTLLDVETTTQLNTRDTNNRSRANHTGTQLASTISDFDSAVSSNSAVVANTAKVTNATHTGDVTGATALTIANGVVSNTKLATVATSTIKGRVSTGTGVVEDLTATQVRTIINVENGAQVNDTGVEIVSKLEALTGEDRLNIDAIDGGDITVESTQFTTGPLTIKTDSVPTASSTHFVNSGNLFTYLSGLEGGSPYTHPDHTGDVTSISDGATTISNNVVSNSKLSDVTTGTIKGRVSAGTGDPEDLTSSQVRTLINVEDGAQVNDTAGQIVIKLESLSGVNRLDASAIKNLPAGDGTINYFNNEVINQIGGTASSYAALTGAVDGVNKIFTVSEAVYLSGTLKVYWNGQLQTQGTSEDWVELNSAAGTFEFIEAPEVGTVITAIYKTSETSSTTFATVTELNDELALKANVTELNDGLALKANTANAMGTVVHGSTAGTARPSGYHVITWIGSVEPTNSINNDIWYDTTP